MHQLADGHRAIWKGAVAGVVGGLVASWMMNRFQGQSQQPSEDEDATTKTADAIAEATLDRKLSKSERQAAAPIVHYGFGSTMGALYGAVAEVAPGAAAGWGVPFGTAVWLGADEIAVPLLGFADGPGEYPLSTHASALAAHLVYGVTADLVRRGVRATLG